jgi:hypothetical protein
MHVAAAGDRARRFGARTDGGEVLAHDDSGMPGEHDLAPLLVSTGAAGDRPHPPPYSAESLV